MFWRTCVHSSFHSEGFDIMFNFEDLVFWNKNPSEPLYWAHKMIRDSFLMAENSCEYKMLPIRLNDIKPKCF